MDRQHIINEIKRVAAINGGVPPGRRRFHAATGMKAADWEGRYWARWGDALAEAGFPPNEFNKAYEEQAVIEAYVFAMRRLGRLPTRAELMMESRATGSPNAKTFRTRLGTRTALIDKLRTFCGQHEGYEDVLAMLPNREAQGQPSTCVEGAADTDVARGYVYLLKSGRFYKIGRTNSVGRREYEVGLKLPLRTALVHEIATDDPTGIEAYWHRRFASRRGNGELFSLTAEDVAAFRRRRLM